MNTLNSSKNAIEVKNHMDNFTQGVPFAVKYNIYGSFLAITVVNAVLIFPVLIGNVLIVFAIQRTPALRTPSNLILCSLAVSDICVGLFALPLRLSRTITLILTRDEMESSIHPFTLFASIYLSGVSVFTITAVSIDRFLSLHLHLRYTGLVTSKRVLIVIISIWVLVMPFTLTYHWNRKLFQYLSAIFTLFMLILVALCYSHIYKIVRRHQRQIQNLCPRIQPASISVADKNAHQNTPDACTSKRVQEVDEKLPPARLKDELKIEELNKLPEQNATSQLNMISLKKTILGSFYVCILFFVCSFPYLVSKVCLAAYGTKKWTIEANEISVMMIFASSALNPIIYCSKMRNLRTAVYKIYLDFIRLDSH